MSTIVDDKKAQIEAHMGGLHDAKRGAGNSESRQTDSPIGCASGGFEKAAAHHQGAGYEASSEGFGMSALPDDLQPLAEADVRRIAKVIGPLSAAQKALDDFEHKRAEGLNPVIGYSQKHSCLVVIDIGTV